MIRKFALIIITLSISLVACSSPSLTHAKWVYGIGSNIDTIKVTQTDFYRDGQLIYSDRIGGGGAGGLLSERITDQQYYWAGGGGLPVNGVPIPDRASIVIFSMYDRKRYRIVVNLPDVLAEQMRQKFQIQEGQDQRNWLYFGLAPGGFYEVLLFGDLNGVSPDKLIARGLAEEVTDDWRDKKIPVTKQYEMSLADFNKKYGELYKKHPIPTGMEWAPIMDAYRAKQPKTDQHPVE